VLPRHHRHWPTSGSCGDYSDATGAPPGRKKTPHAEPARSCKRLSGEQEKARLGDRELAATSRFRVSISDTAELCQQASA
jgi:hypothetical protein